MLALALVTTLAVVLTKDADGNDDADGGTGPAVATAPHGQATAPVSPSAGAPTRTITIGFQGPLSGDNQPLGDNAVGGVKTAIEEANARGNLPFTLRLATSDDLGHPDTAPLAANALAANPDVLAVVGPMFSGATQASEPLYSGAGLLSVSPSASSPILTTQGFSTFYRVVPTDAAQGPAAAAYVARVLRPGKVYSLDDGLDYSVGLGRGFELALLSSDISFVHDRIDPAGDFSAEAGKIMAANPDLVFYAGYYPELALLAKALQDKGYTGKLMSGDGSLDPAYISLAGAAAEGTLLTCGCLLPSGDPNAKSFVTSYQKVNGTGPGTYSAEAYDATNAIIKVLSGLGADATRASVAAAFARVDLQGITRHLAFQPGGEVVDGRIFIYQARSGNLTMVDSAS
ncbi:branched chain amino acid ABC transporter substrate-binding protein [Pseudofrankia asymbiotica]|uniref:Branched chain amino acid ABC transporter substrate-binding protein n=1 Tax=Pseudofrankia asymbiotica TaxID=1834516 RepID=A0A1V2I1W4_9ACTN|nr:branched chain amino acid ABC transporter substrate-binding protein [Pseudofrankia asymbiotica]